MSLGDTFDISDVHLLLVEDSDDDAFLFRKEIEKGLEYALVDDIRLTRVDSLAAAIDACQEQSFDAVFLDLGLPDSNGLETIERFTDHDFGLPVIVLTGLRDEQTSLAAIQQGAQDYLVKGDSGPETMVRVMRHAIEREANERRVRRQRDQLDFFNSILRHDMLNGLQIIQLRAHSLSDRLESDELSDVEGILTWTENIIDLTEKTRDILDVLTGGEQAELKPIPVRERLEEMSEDIEQIREGVTVELDCPACVTVRANDLLEDVLRNLLTNAVEHTKPDPVTVTVRAEERGETVRLVVEDDGPGIPEAQQDSLFGRGEKGTDSTGTGFGLYFVKSMVDIYSGNVRVESAKPGARFVMELPPDSADSGDSPTGNLW